MTLEERVARLEAAVFPPAQPILSDADKAKLYPPSTPTPPPEPPPLTRR